MFGRNKHEKVITPVTKEMTPNDQSNLHAFNENTALGIAGVGGDSSLEDSNKNIRTHKNPDFKVTDVSKRDGLPQPKSWNSDPSDA